MNIFEKYKARKGGGEQDFMNLHTDNVKVTSALGDEDIQKNIRDVKKVDRKKSRLGNDVSENVKFIEFITKSIFDLREELDNDERRILDDILAEKDEFESFVQALIESCDDDYNDDENDEKEKKLKEWKNVIDEARNDSWKKKWVKWNWNTTPWEILQYVRSVDDDTLLLLYKHVDKDKDIIDTGSERDLQLKAIKRELKRRFRISPDDKDFMEKVKVMKRLERLDMLRKENGIHKN